MASVRWSRDALTDLEELDFLIARRIVAKAAWLEEHFTDIVPERLHRDLKNLYKLRVGDYRVIYAVRKDMLTIEAVGHRRDIYR